MRTLIALCLVLFIAGQLAAQRIPRVARADLPIGLGIAKVLAKPGAVLRFYNPRATGESPGDVPPSDVVPPEGWIRWRRGERLLVAFNPLN